MKINDVPWAAHSIADCAKRFIPKFDEAMLRSEITSRLSRKLNYCARTQDSLILTSANETGFMDKRVGSIDALIVGRAGDGAKLLREYLHWWKDKPAIRGIVWTPMFNWDERFEHLTARLGFTRVGGMFQIWR